MKDAFVLSQIVHSVNLAKDDVVIEVGSGDGALTKAILQQGVKVISFEKDSRFAHKLHKELILEDNAVIVEQDALKVDWQTQVPDSSVFMANIPYQITAPLLFTLLYNRNKFKSFTIVMQKEVAMRLLATPTGEYKKEYSALSIIFKYAFSIELICIIPPEAFSPPPKVDSAAVLLMPKQGTIENEKDYFTFVRALFQQRRKQMGSKLQTLLPNFLNSLDEDQKQSWKQKRPQELQSEDFMLLYTAYLQEKNEI